MCLLLSREETQLSVPAGQQTTEKPSDIKAGIPPPDFRLQVSLRPLPSGSASRSSLLLRNKAAKPQSEPAAAALALGVIALEFSERSNSLNY
ncbi:MORC family CW-type zinc finger protein 3 [Dissostichus eleginoides]|uniref:MORC family CW-type zinc finger protein 3 n=1 Tax=Dissostichus eleginoides TaxID=100907 RepID=A0AAD9FG01_DISEL|nr:MORC family CW-type zinc finger protein 3 [Dissostichus eleginoides]